MYNVQMTDSGHGQFCMGLHSCTKRTQADCPPCKADQDQKTTFCGISLVLLSNSRFNQFLSLGWGCCSSSLPPGGSLCGAHRRPVCMKCWFCSRWMTATCTNSTFGNQRPRHQTAIPSLRKYQVIMFNSAIRSDALIQFTIHVHNDASDLIMNSHLGKKKKT